MAATVYVVLEAMDEPNGTWIEIGRQKANGTKQAIRTLLAKKVSKDGEHFKVAASYVAVPERSFQPERPAVRTEQRVVFGTSMAEADKQ